MLTQKSGDSQYLSTQTSKQTHLRVLTQQLLTRSDGDGGNGVLGGGDGCLAQGVG